MVSPVKTLPYLIKDIIHLDNHSGVFVNRRIRGISETALFEGNPRISRK
jgi:hypothetical protein